MPIDKIMFIYKYGSKKAKKMAVDEKLKMQIYPSFSYGDLWV